jgi:hypothetical protein
MRKLSSTAMAAMVIAALFWGNCFSCPQLLLASTTQNHGCCHHPKPVKTECQSQGLKHFVKADAGAQVPMVATTATVEVAAADFAPGQAVPVAAEYSPPDLLALHSSFRI